MVNNIYTVYTGKIAALPSPPPPILISKSGCGDLSRGRLPPVINHSILAYVCHYPGPVYPVWGWLNNLWKGFAMRGKPCLKAILLWGLHQGIAKLYSRRVIPRLWGPNPPCGYISSVAIFLVYTVAYIYIAFKMEWGKAVYMHFADSISPFWESLHSSGVWWKLSTMMGAHCTDQARAHEDKIACMLPVEIQHQNHREFCHIISSYGGASTRNQEPKNSFVENLTHIDITSRNKPTFMTLQGIQAQHSVMRTTHDKKLSVPFLLHRFKARMVGSFSQVPWTEMVDSTLEASLLNLTLRRNSSSPRRIPPTASLPRWPTRSTWPLAVFAFR